MLTLTDFYTAFSPACFSLLALWLAIITINPGAWLNSPESAAAARSPESGRRHLTPRQRQAYTVALYFAAPGTMSLLALIDPQSTSWWRSFFIITSVLGGAGLIWAASPHRAPHPDALEVSDHPVHWLAMGLYMAIAVLAFLPLHTLRIEGVLLTVLMLLGVHLALMLMFAAMSPRGKASR
jgi:cell division protein FtsW (lipid II flippase)